MPLSRHFFFRLALLAGLAPQVLTGPLSNHPRFPSRRIDSLNVAPTSAPPPGATEGSILLSIPPTSSKAVLLERRQISNSTSSSSSSSTSVPAQTSTVSGGATITVLPGVVVVGGPGGGTFVVGGESVPIAEGETEVAGESSGPDPTPTPTTTTTPTPTPTPSPSPSPSPDNGVPAPYIIIPVNGTSIAQAEPFTATLKDSIKAIAVDDISDADLGFFFWTANLTSSQVLEVSKDPIVAKVISDLVEYDFDPEVTEPTRKARRSNDYPTSSLWQRDGEIIKQSNATLDTRAFSQPKGQAIDVVENFAYDSQAGVGVTVYVFDTGANIEHPEYINMPGTKRWIFTDSDETQTDWKRGGHGSCVLSKVAGPTYGTAKRSDIVVVKQKQPNSDRLYVSIIVKGLLAIKDDVKANSLSGKAVVNMSFGPILKDEELIQDIENVLLALIKIDVVLVTASGNDRSYEDDLEAYPAKFSQDMPIIVVGATDNAGNRADFSQGTTKLTVSAPGDDIICAGQTGSKLKDTAGTSFAAPAVAGLAAYYLSLDQYRTRLQVPGSVAQKVKDLIVETAWARPNSKEGLLVAWNGQESDIKQCQSSNGVKNKRQGCVPSTTSSTSSSSSTSTSPPTSTPSNPGSQPCPSIPRYEGDDRPRFSCPGGEIELTNQGSFYTAFSSCTDDAAVELILINGTKIEGFNVAGGYQGSSTTFEPCTWTAAMIPKPAR